MCKKQSGADQHPSEPTCPNPGCNAQICTSKKSQMSSSPLNESPPLRANRVAWKKKLPNHRLWGKNEPLFISCDPGHPLPCLPTIPRCRTDGSTDAHTPSTFLGSASRHLSPWHRFAWRPHSSCPAGPGLASSLPHDIGMALPDASWSSASLGGSYGFGSWNSTYEWACHHSRHCHRSLHRGRQHARHQRERRLDPDLQQIALQAMYASWSICILHFSVTCMMIVVALSFFVPCRSRESSRGGGRWTPLVLPLWHDRASAARRLLRLQRQRHHLPLGLRWDVSMYVANWLITGRECVIDLSNSDDWLMAIVMQSSKSVYIILIFLDMCIIVTQSSSAYQQRTWFGLPGRPYHRHSGRRRSPGEDGMRQQVAGSSASQRSHPESSPNTEASLHHARRLRTVARWISWPTSIP
jgi:hypothetical protein